MGSVAIFVRKVWYGYIFLQFASVVIAVIEMAFYPRYPYNSTK